MDSIIASVGAEMYVGGKYSPRECMARHKVAIVVPYRNRKAQLALFLEHMHPILKRQQLDYGIYVVNQADSNEFNRAMLFNVGFVEALKEANWDCFIFHDVDLLPEDDRNLYTCPDTPRHMSVAVNTFKYELPYPGIFGGVIALTKSHILTVNGFSNQFWGWGGEDDDMANRVTHNRITVSRYKPAIARYTMAKHKKEKPSEQGVEILKNGRKYFHTDGLNNLQYDLVSKKQFLLYTSISVALKHVQPLALLPASNS
ncbi:beta-1,4-galactosyltransferase 4-like [Tigriopus californicus]|nr:beta-1,4-galactosyltransferase 4-like [Tigriopus californicus]